jgi:hypothetical protein
VRHHKSRLQLITILSAAPRTHLGEHVIGNSLQRCVTGFGCVSYAGSSVAEQAPVYRAIARTSRRYHTLSGSPAASPQGPPYQESISDQPRQKQQAPIRGGGKVSTSGTSTGHAAFSAAQLARACP